MRYYITRLIQSAVTFFFGMFVTYSLYRLMPGGPMEAIIAREVQQRQAQGEQIQAGELAERVERLSGINPDEGILEGYMNWMTNIILNQDFGRSIIYSEPAFDVLFRAMPWTLFIAGYGLLLGFVTMVVFGSLMAWKEGGKTDSGLTVFFLTLGSIPYYVLAVVMLAVLGFQWELFPTGGRYPTSTNPGFNLEFMIGVVRHGTLPILSTLVLAIGAGALGMRANTVRIMGADYLRSAELRGLGTNRILTRYLARNAILPIYTQMMVGIAGLFSGAVITEFIFQYPGVGWYLYEAFMQQDYPLLMASFVFLGGMTVIAILIADLTYGLIDPRAGSGSNREAF